MGRRHPHTNNRQRRKQIQKYSLVIKKINSKVNPQWKVFHLWLWYDLVMLMDVWYIIVGLEIEGNFLEIDQMIEKPKHGVAEVR